MNRIRSRPAVPAGVGYQSSWNLLLTMLGTVLVVCWAAVWQWKLRMEIALAVSIAVALLGLGVLALRQITATRLARAPGTPVPRAFARSTPVAADSELSANGRRWTLDVFADIDTRHFAALCEAWFTWAGFDTRSETHRADEGVDIWLHAPRMPGPVAIVRCKHWLDKPVGLREMQEFCGLVSEHKTAHGTYTTTSTYTQEALDFAQQHGIDAVDGRGLLRRIQSRTRQSQQALLAVAFKGSATA